MTAAVAEDFSLSLAVFFFWVACAGALLHARNLLDGHNVEH